MECKCESCVRENCQDRTKQGDFRTVIGCADYLKQNTNADRIRAMSDGELAKFLSTPCECVVSPEEDGYIECGNDLCKKRLLEWLKQPAEE